MDNILQAIVNMGFVNFLINNFFFQVESEGETFMPTMTILGIVLPCCFISISYISIYWRVRSTGISISYIYPYIGGLDPQVYPYPIYPYILEG